MVYGIMAGKYFYKGVDLNNLVIGFSGNVWDKTETSDDAIGCIRPYSFGYFRGTLDLSTKYGAPVAVFSANTYVDASNTITYANVNTIASSNYSGYNVILMGGGGGGGAGSTSGKGGGGGAGGFFMVKNIKIQDYTLNVGKSGDGGSYGITAKSGGNTYISSVSANEKFNVYGGNLGRNITNGQGGGLYGNYTNTIKDSNNNSTTVIDLNTNTVSDGTSGSVGASGTSNFPHGGVGTNIYVDGGTDNQRGKGGNGGLIGPNGYSITNGYNGAKGIAYFLCVKV